MKKPQFATEAELCAAFIAWVHDEAGKFRNGVQTPAWTVYAETAGWDILLVAADGTQIGVQAKLRFNMKVLTQCVPDCWDQWRDVGPDYRAVLVPERDGAHENLCAALGLVLFTACGSSVYRGDGPRTFGPALNMEHWNGGWHYWSPAKRCPLPEFVPDVVAGSSAPVQLTKWKIAALRIIATLEVKGHVTRQDFRIFGVDPRRWTGPGGWLAPGATPGQFVRGAALDFDAQHPSVYAQIVAEVREKHLKAERSALGLFAEAS